jgi:hypothetical protein
VYISLPICAELAEREFVVPVCTSDDLAGASIEDDATEFVGRKVDAHAIPLKFRC